MKVTETTKRALAYRREKRQMVKEGYLEMTPNLYHEIRCGWLAHRPIITDVKIGCDQQTLYVKLEKEK